MIYSRFALHGILIWADYPSLQKVRRSWTCRFDCRRERGTDDSIGISGCYDRNDWSLAVGWFLECFQMSKGAWKEKSGDWAGKVGGLLKYLVVNVLFETRSVWHRERCSGLFVVRWGSRRKQGTGVLWSSNDDFVEYLEAWLAFPSRIAAVKNSWLFALGNMSILNHETFVLDCESTLLRSLNPLKTSAIDPEGWLPWPSLSNGTKRAKLLSSPMSWEIRTSLGLRSQDSSDTHLTSI